MEDPSILSIEEHSSDECSCSDECIEISSDEDSSEDSLDDCSEEKDCSDDGVEDSSMEDGSEDSIDPCSADECSSLNREESITGVPLPTIT